MAKNHNGAQVLVRVPRGRRKHTRFISTLGRKPEYLYSFHFEGNFVWVTMAEFEHVTAWPGHGQKPGVTRARVDVTKLLKCW